MVTRLVRWIFHFHEDKVTKGDSFICMMDHIHGMFGCIIHSNAPTTALFHCTVRLEDGEIYHYNFFCHKAPSSLSQHHLPLWVPEAGRLSRTSSRDTVCIDVASLSILNAGRRYISAILDTEGLTKPEINPITRPLLNYHLLKHFPYVKQQPADGELHALVGLRRCSGSHL